MKRLQVNAALKGILLLAFMLFTVIPAPVTAATATEIDKQADLALEKLYASTPAAKELASVAKAMLIFPDIVKTGLIVGGQYGEGALRVAGETVGYYIL